MIKVTKKPVFTQLTDNPQFIDQAVVIIDLICPIHNSPATKYSIRDYFMGICKVFEKYTYWCDYEGDIKWKTLHAKYRQWCKLGIFEEIHKQLLNGYLKHNKTSKLKYQSIDSTSIVNKQGASSIDYNVHTGKKKYIKASAICDSVGVPLGFHLFPGNESDMNTINASLDNVPIDLNTIKYSKNNRYKQYMLADSGYCSKKNRAFLRKRGYVPLIWYNKRNIKDASKMKKLNETEQRKYKKRRIIESTFAWLKQFPKINCLYEKTTSSFYGLLYLGACYIISNKM